MRAALLIALVAISATSRKRYPDRKAVKDNEAFKSFLGDELPVVTNGTVEWTVNCLGEMIPIQDFFYKRVRCELAHEGGLPDDVEFIVGDADQLYVQIDPNKVTLGDSWISRLMRAVIFAPENSKECLLLPPYTDESILRRIFGESWQNVTAMTYSKKRTDFQTAWLARM